jgi:hypothetical protein
MMVLIAVEELVDVNPWHGLRFGNLEPVEAGAIERYRVAGSLYDVECSRDGLLVRRDGRQLFRSDGPVEVRHVRVSGARVAFEVRTRDRVALQAGRGSSRTYEAGLSRGFGEI